MNRKLCVLFIILICLFLSACQSQHIEIQKSQQTASIKEGVNQEMREIYIQIDNYLCKAELYQNKTTKALLETFSATFDMKEMNGNEKYYYLDKALPTIEEKVTLIKAGDIMLFGNNCLVIFYKDIQTQYAYTKLGHITDVSEFLEKLPKDQIKVTFHKEW